MRRSRCATASSPHERTCGRTVWRCTRCSHLVKTHSCPPWRSIVSTKKCCWLIWRRVCDCPNPRPVRWRSTPPSCIRAGGSSPANDPPSSKSLKSYSSLERRFVLNRNYLLTVLFDFFILMWRSLLNNEICWSKKLVFLGI